MKVAILQAGHFVPELKPRLGDYTRLYRNLLCGHGYEFEFETFSVVDMDFPDGADVADAFLISGSKHGAYEDLPFIPPLEALIREIRDSGKPLIGICFGHQIIAQALGGKVIKFPQGWAVGRHEYRMEGKQYALNAWHQDQVVEVPKGATTVGTSDFCAHAALRYADRIWSMQPHPEFGADVVAGLLHYRGNLIPKERAAAAQAQLAAADDNAMIGRMMAQFLAKERL